MAGLVPNNVTISQERMICMPLWGDNGFDLKVMKSAMMSGFIFNPVAENYAA